MTGSDVQKLRDVYWPTVNVLLNKVRNCMFPCTGNNSSLLSVLAINATYGTGNYVEGDYKTEGGGASELIPLKKRGGGEEREEKV